MKEVIDRIVKTEEEAKKKAELARKLAGEMILEAENKAHKLVEETRQKASLDREELLRKVEIDSLEKKKQAIEDASRNAEALVKEKSSLVNGIADRIFNKIIKTET